MCPKLIKTQNGNMTSMTRLCRKIIMAKTKMQLMNLLVVEDHLINT